MWRKIGKDEIKSVEIGDKVRVNGVETKLTRHFPGLDFGFRTEDPVNYVNWQGIGDTLCIVFAEEDWAREDYTVEVWEEV